MVHFGPVPFVWVARGLVVRCCVALCCGLVCILISGAFVSFCFHCVSCVSYQVSEGINVVLQHNIVAGFERVGYRIDGEPCPGNALIRP